MGSLLGRLEAREAAARVRVEALRAEMAALAERLAAQEEVLSRLQITKETVIEVLAGPDLPGEGADGAGAAAASVSASQDAALSAAASAAPVGMSVQVPAFEPGGDGRALPVAYRDVVEVLVGAGVPLRARQLCQALGVGAEPRHVEGMRSKLKRLVRRGWLAEVEPGLFACASGVAGVDVGLDGATGGQVKVRGSSS